MSASTTVDDRMSNLRYPRPNLERLKEIEQALVALDHCDRTPMDHTIGELLTEIYYLRGGQ